MADSKSFLTAGVILACLSLIAFFAGFAVPVIQHTQLKQKIQKDNMLTRENAKEWAEEPGLRNISITKTFTIFDLKSDVGDIIAGRANVEEVMSVPYNYTYAYKDLLYAPGFNGSIKYHKRYDHTYLGGDEAVLKNTFVKTLNVGAFAGIHQQGDLNKAQLFVQSLYRIYTSFQLDIVKLIIAEYAFNFYVHDQNLTNSTIFMYQDTVSAEMSERLWYDKEYGWSRNDTLAIWIGITLNNPFNPSADPSYSILKFHFGLNDDQMTKLVGATPQGKLGPSSQLFLIKTAIQTVQSSIYECKTAINCTTDELFAMQFFEARITKEPVFDDVKPQDSIANLNTTFHAAPEVVAVLKDKKVSFSSDMTKALFMLSADKKAPEDSKQTLFSMTNVQYIIDNSKNLTDIENYLTLESTDQAQVLVDYVDYIVESFAYQGQKEELKALKVSADVAASSLNRLAKDFKDLLAINLTALGTNVATYQAKLTCSVILRDVEASADLIKNICDNPDITLDTFEGQVPWIAAFYQAVGSDEYRYIQDLTNITDTDLQALLSESSSFGKIIQDVTTAIAESIGCVHSPCDPNYISTLQWLNAGFTRNLPIQYYDGKKYETITEIFPGHFGDFIPEITVFARKVLNKTFTFSFDQAEACLNYDVGSLNNNYEALKLFSLYQKKDYAAIKERFNFTEEEANVLMAYIDSTFLDYHLGGLIKNSSVYDLLWGYEDNYIKRINNSNFFENLQLFNNRVDLLGSKNNTVSYVNESFNMIDSGTHDPARLRVVSSYRENQTLSKKKTYFDGNQYRTVSVAPWNGVLMRINGTDSSGFQTLGGDLASVTVFEENFMRDLSYKLKSKVTYGLDAYEFNTYTLDTDQFKASSTYLNDWTGYVNLTSLKSSPILVSLPYFKGCDSFSYNQITFNGTSPSVLQNNIESGTFVVEALTGITANYTKNYQFSIHNVFPYLLTRQNSLAAIPIMSINEVYTTPDDNYDSDLMNYHKRARQIFVATITAFVFAAITIVIAALSMRMYYNKKNEEETEEERVGLLRDHGGHASVPIQINAGSDISGV